jgi:hypothetical protein
LSNNGAGRLGCGPRLEAKTQFARRLIIGFDGAETNHTRGEPVGPVRQVILDEWVSELKEISGCGDRRRNGACSREIRTLQGGKSHGQ